MPREFWTFNTESLIKKLKRLTAVHVSGNPHLSVLSTAWIQIIMAAMQYPQILTGDAQYIYSEAEWWYAPNDVVGQVCQSGGHYGLVNCLDRVSREATVELLLLEENQLYGLSNYPVLKRNLVPVTENWPLRGLRYYWRLEKNAVITGIPNKGFPVGNTVR